MGTVAASSQVLALDQVELALRTKLLGLVSRGGVQPHVVTLEGREVRSTFHLLLPAQDLPPWGLSLQPRDAK